MGREQGESKLVEGRKAEDEEKEKSYACLFVKFRLGSESGYRE